MNDKSGYGHDNFPASPYREGNKVLIRTVTHYWVGRIIQIGTWECLLSDASWIPDTGRWSHALKTGELEEIEPTPGVVSVKSDTIVDVVFWTHPLPTEVK